MMGVRIRGLSKALTSIEQDALVSRNAFLECICFFLKISISEAVEKLDIRTIIILYQQEVNYGDCLFGAQEKRE